MTDIWTQKDRYAEPVRGKKGRAKCPALFLEKDCFEGVRPRPRQLGLLGAMPPAPQRQKGRKTKIEKTSQSIRRAHLRIAFGNARAPCREPRHCWRLGKDAPRASRCPRRGQKQGRKISPRSQRRKATTRSDAKRSRPKSEACLDRMSERSTVASRRAGGISPWWSRVCLFWPLGGP